MKRVNLTNKLADALHSAAGYIEFQIEMGPEGSELIEGKSDEEIRQLERACEYIRQQARKAEIKAEKRKSK